MVRSVRTSLALLAVSLSSPALAGAPGGPQARTWDLDGFSAPTPDLIGARSFVQVGGRALFDARVDWQGSLPWASDGTPAGTGPLAGTSAFGLLAGPVVAAGTAFFATIRDEGGREILYETDGTTAGTRRSRLFDAVPSARFDATGYPLLGLAPGHLTALSDDPADGCLYESDGAHPARCVARFTNEPRVARAPSWMVNLGDRVLFMLTDAAPKSTRSELWSSLPEAAPQRLLEGGWFALLGVLDGGRAVVATAQALYVTDGTPANTRAVRSDVGAWLGGAVLNGALVFLAANAAELWRTDGTTPGTERIATLGGLGALASSVRTGDGRTGFVTTSAPGAIWVTDGTAAGTRRVAEVPSPRLEGVRGGVAFYTSRDAQGRSALARSDGTSPGTFAIVPELDPSEEVAAILPLGALLVRPMPRTAGTPVLRIAEGMTPGARVLVAAAEATQGVDPRWLTAFAGGLSFAGSVTAWDVRGLYRMDGGAPVPELLMANVTDLAVSGERLVYLRDGVTLLARSADGATQELGVLSSPGDCRLSGAVAGGRVYLACSAFGTPGELWEVAGGVLRRYPGASFTEVALAGERTVLASTDPGFALATLQDGQRVALADASTVGSPRSLTSVGATAFSLSGDDALWATDGTREGTRLVRALGVPRGGLPTLPKLLGAVGGRLWFAAHDDAHGTELWTSDGTAAGTAMLADLVPGPGSSTPFGFTEAGAQVFFWADAGDGDGPVPWVASTSGPLHARPLAPAHPYLWSLTGGVLRGTSFVPLGHEGVVLFTGRDLADGTELWISDGTPQHTRMVADLFPGPGSSAPSEITPVGLEVYFAATRPDGGRELFAYSLGELLGLVAGPAAPNPPWTSPDAAPAGGGRAGGGRGGCSSAGAPSGAVAALLVLLALRARRD